MITARRDPRLEARIVASWPLEGVRAGSALVWRGGRLLVIQDDVPAVALVDPATRRVERLVLEGSGAALAKATKPDFEAAVLSDDGTVHLLGSGSTPARRRIARIDAHGAVRLFEAAALYDALAAEIDGTPNLEGAAIVGGVLRLLHRGCGRDPSASVDVAIGCLEGGSPTRTAARRYDLGRIGDVALGFTDAAPWRAFAMLYLAVAEDTPNAIEDGAIVGGAVGVLAGVEARFAPLLEPDRTPSARKAEGIAMDPEGVTGWLVTDPDDPLRPAELCRLELAGPW